METISRPPSDALLVIDSADRSSSSSETGVVFAVPQTQPYNSFRLNKAQNILQGSFTQLQLVEINFPYAIPNVNPRNNQFWVQVNKGGLQTAQIVLSVGIGLNLSPQGLRNAVASALQSSSVGTAIGITWIVSYDTISQGFTIQAQDTAIPIDFYTFALFPINPASVGTVPVGKSLLDVMGFNSLTNWTGITTQTLGKQSVGAPMVYTKYIDIVSDALTYFQNVRDGSSKKSSNSNIICRLYISDENSSQPATNEYWNGTSAVEYSSTFPVGNIPYIIHRQFQNPKSFKWVKNNSISAIDIKLYDDVGEPLYFPPAVPPLPLLNPSISIPDFQITFKATEE
jgi:hypothetical protein